MAEKAGQWDREHQGEGWWGDGDRKGLSDKVSLSKHLKETSQVDIWKESILPRRNRKGMGSKPGTQRVRKRVVRSQVRKVKGSR